MAAALVEVAVLNGIVLLTFINGGRTATVISDGVQRLDVVVRFLSEFRDRPDQIARRLVSAPGGIPVPLSQLARLDPGGRCRSAGRTGNAGWSCIRVECAPLKPHV